MDGRPEALVRRKREHFMRYQLIRSKRKTIGIQVKDEKVIVRAPLKASMQEIERFVQASQGWIEKHLKEQAERRRQEAQNQEPRLTHEQIEELAREAMRVIPGRTAFYASLLGVTYGRITIRNQRTRWGSCSAKGNLNFNCLLMLAPREVLDSVVVHELCHRLEMNHSKKFYEHVLSVYPDYYKQHAWLREHGPALMKRMTG